MFGSRPLQQLFSVPSIDGVLHPDEQVVAMVYPRVAAQNNSPGTGADVVAQHEATSLCRLSGCAKVSPGGSNVTLPLLYLQVFL